MGKIYRKLTSKLFIVCCMIAIVGALVVGCVTSNPHAGEPVVTQTPNGPATNPSPAYIPDPRIASTSNTVANVAGFLAPANPYAGATDMLIKLGFGIAFIASGYLAKMKSSGSVIAALKDDNTTKLEQLKVMATGIVAAGPSAIAKVQEVASSTDYHGAIADHINNATP